MSSLAYNPQQDKLLLTEVNSYLALRYNQMIEKHANDTRRQDFILKIYTALIQVANPINHDELLKQAAVSADKILNNEI